MTEAPIRRSKKLIAIGLVSLTYSISIAISLTLAIAGNELAARTTLFLLALPWIAFGAALAFVALTAKLPKPAEEFQKEYEEVLKEVERRIEEWKRSNELGGVS